MGLCVMVLVALLLASANHLYVPPACWLVLACWAAIKFAMIWFGYGLFGGDGDE
jgi:hypothetical protein